MQSRANNQVDKNRDKAAQELWDATMRAIDRNGVVFVLALARYAGYGQKRLNDFLAVLNETMDEYHQHCLDGVFDIRYRLNSNCKSPKERLQNILMLTFLRLKNCRINCMITQIVYSYRR